MNPNKNSFTDIRKFSKNDHEYKVSDAKQSDSRDKKSNNDSSSIRNSYSGYEGAAEFSPNY